MDWQEEYKIKLTTAEEAVKIVKSGDRVAVGGSIDEPVALSKPDRYKHARTTGYQSGGSQLALQLLQQMYNVATEGRVGESRVRLYGYF
ncbi:hypothetical protein ES703_51466 [subsurface metagenome]